MAQGSGLERLRLRSESLFACVSKRFLIKVSVLKNVPGPILVTGDVFQDTPSHDLNSGYLTPNEFAKVTPLVGDDELGLVDLADCILADHDTTA